MNTQVKDIGLVIMSIVIVVIAFMAFPKIDNAVKTRAISECAKAASSTAAEGGFNGGVYKICVEDAGYVTKIK